MRKPRDFDSELQALSDKAKLLKDRRLSQLGELVISTGAAALPIEQLAGALLAAAGTSDAATREEWRKRGAAFFRGAPRSAAGGNPRGASGPEASDGSPPSAAGKAGA